MIFNSFTKRYSQINIFSVNFAASAYELLLVQITLLKTFVYFSSHIKTLLSSAPIILGIVVIFLIRIYSLRRTQDKYFYLLYI